MSIVIRRGAGADAILTCVCHYQAEENLTSAYQICHKDAQKNRE